MNYDSLFLLKEEELKYTLKEGYPIVKAGSIDALIAKTLDPYYQGTTCHLMSCLIACADAEYIDILLSTYNYFLPTVEFLNRIINL